MTADYVVLVHAPLAPDAIARTLGVRAEYTGRAPHFAQSWAEVRAQVQAPLRGVNLPLEGVVVVGDTSFERDWCEAGRLAGYISAGTYFAPPGSPPSEAR